MHVLLICVLSNVIVAFAMACIILVISRYWKNPTVLHAMWLLVLIKLVTPPVMQLPCLPNSLSWEQATTEVALAPASSPSITETPANQPKISAAPTQQQAAPVHPDSNFASQLDSNREIPDHASEESPTARESKTSSPLPQLVETSNKSNHFEEAVALNRLERPSLDEAPADIAQTPSTPRQVPIAIGTSTATKEIAPPTNWMSWAVNILGIIWLVGALFAIGRTFIHWYRFHQLVRESCDSHSRCLPLEITQLVDDVAKRMNFSKPPQTLMVNVAVAPMIWPSARGAILILPTQLVSNLSRAQVHSLVAHELAHLRTNHHWFRWLERAVASLYWWLPLVTIVSRQLRQCEEEVCDAWVVDLLPGNTESYATLLVDTATYLAQSRTTVPSLGIGMNHFSQLKRRITMIMHQQTRPQLSTAGWLAIIATAIMGIGFSPTLTSAKNPPQKPLNTSDDVTRNDELPIEYARDTDSLENTPLTEDDLSELNFEGIVSTQLAVLLDELDHFQSALNLENDIFEMGFEMEPTVRETTKKMLSRFPSASGQNLGIIVGSDLRKALVKVVRKEFADQTKLEDYLTSLDQYYGYHDKLGQQFFISFIDAHLCLSETQETEIKKQIESNWDSCLNFTHFQPDFVACGKICRELVGDRALEEILTPQQWGLFKDLDQLMIARDQIIDGLMNNTGFDELESTGNKLMQLQLAELQPRYSLTPQQLEVLSASAKTAASEVAQNWQQLAESNTGQTSRWNFERQLPRDDAERILQPLIYQIIERESWNSGLAQILTADQIEDWESSVVQRQQNESRKFCAMFMYLLNQQRTLSTTQVEFVVNAITQQTDVQLGSCINLNRLHQLIFSLGEADWKQAIPAESWESTWPQLQLWMSQIKDRLPDE